MLNELLAVFGIGAPTSIVVEFGLVLGLIYFAYKFYEARKK